MRLEISIPKTTAYKVDDNPYSILDSTAEFYHTYQLCELESLTDDAASPWAKQGFSLTGSPDDGVNYSAGTVRNQTDLAAAFDITKRINSMQNGVAYNVRMDFHTWESDRSTLKVRGAFTDTTLAVLIKAWEDANQNENEAKKRLEEWLSNNREDLAKAIINVAKITEAPWVSFAMGSILPLFNLIVEVVKNNSDDYLWADRFILELKKDLNGVVSWRINKIGDRNSNWHKVGESVDIAITSSDNANGNVLELIYRFSIR